MHIGIIGGIERGWTTYERLAAAHGHEVELHGGHTHGRGQEVLESLVRRSDLLVVVTGINSHSAVIATRKLVRQYNKRILIMKSCGTSRFVHLLEALEGRAEIESYARAG